MKVMDFGGKGLYESTSEIASYSQLQWVDFTRSEALLLGSVANVLHDQHRKDLLNSIHPPYFEQTDDYEMIIFRSMDERFEFTGLKTRSIAFLIYENTVFSVHDDDDSTFNRIHERFRQSRKKLPKDVLSLAHFLFNEIVDEFLSLREPLTLRVSEWQKRLLDPKDPFNDWLVIMQAKSSLSRLNTNLELQKDVLLNWQENTRYPFDASLSVRFNDLHEHLSRIERMSSGVQTDLESLTQIYFASSGQQTNVNVQILAVISAIFLPLNLIAGIFGMNFEGISFLRHPLGAYIVIGLMAALSVILLWWFKKKNWY